MRVGTDVHGVDETLDMLGEISDRLGDMRPAMEAVAVAIRRFAEARFTARTGPDGQPWAPLKGTSKDRGVLRGSIYANATDSGVTFGASAPWADEHQFGTARMPARPFLPTAEFTTGPAAQLREEIAKIIRRYVALEEAAAADSGSDDIDFNF